MSPGRNWRSTASERNGRLVPLPDDWSLMDAASGLAIARIHAEPDGGWRCACRSIIESELKDCIMGWFKTVKEAAWLILKIENLKIHLSSLSYVMKS